MRRAPVGPAVGEPPLLADPRRWGSIIGLVGGMTFIAGNGSVLGTAGSAVAWAAGLGLVAAALFAHYVRPVPLGPLARPRRFAVATYVACVAAELAMFGAGTRILSATDHSDLRPALIAVVVGVHFVPLGWAFHQLVFLVLGGAVAASGVIGLAAGALGVTGAADAMAVVAGFLMLLLLVLHAQGHLPRVSA